MREFLSTLPDRPNDRTTVARIRAYLESLGRPDVRYLVATIRGAGADVVARYARGVLKAAGASVAAAGDPLDEPLLAVAGTSVAATAYQLSAQHLEVGELSRGEAGALIAFVAHAEASRRVLLLLDEAIDPLLPAHGALPDVIAIGHASDAAATLAIADVPDRRPIIFAPRDPAGISDAMRARAVPYVLGGRDFAVASSPGGFDLAVADERYGALSLGPGDDPELAATGVVTALAIGAFGIRMRGDWVTAGAGIAAARE